MVAALFAFFRYSRWGLAMRAAAFDQETALAQGVSVGGVFAVSWAMAGALAADRRRLRRHRARRRPGTTWLIALMALPAIILGGLDSLGGAVVGGLLVGVVGVARRQLPGEYLALAGQQLRARSRRTC